MKQWKAKPAEALGVDAELDWIDSLADDAIRSLGKALANFDEMAGDEGWDKGREKKVRKQMVHARLCLRCIVTGHVPRAREALQAEGRPAAARSAVNDVQLT